VSALTFRQADLKDADTLLDIEAGCFKTDGFNRRQFRYLLRRAKALTLVACWDKRVVGYCLLLLPAHPRPARLYSVAVLSAYRGKGIAEQLIQRAIARMKAAGYTRLRLEVSKKNAAAQSLYRRLGFADIAELPGYYEDGGDGIRMQCDLEQSQAASELCAE